jgi:hypothetical protein
VIRVGAFLLSGLVALTAGCAEHVGALPGSDASLGGEARDMSISDVPPSADAAACSCPTGLFVDVVGDGDTLHLTSADVGSSYLDRSGQTLHADATLTWPPPPQLQLMQSFDGSYALKLEDGRTLSGTFNACLIAFLNFA